LRREEANTGEELFAVLLRSLPGKSYLEILAADVTPSADSWARASRASMGANITLPPRRRRTSIPANCARVLATPCALGRIRVTVGFAFTGWIKQPPCHRENGSNFNYLRDSSYRIRGGM
jgi:hypothetical protein